MAMEWIDEFFYQTTLQCYQMNMYLEHVLKLISFVVIYRQSVKIGKGAEVCQMVYMWYRVYGLGIDLRAKFSAVACVDFTCQY